jgi:hypothetical protein
MKDSSAPNGCSLGPQTDVHAALVYDPPHHVGERCQTCPGWCLPVRRQDAVEGETESAGELLKDIQS